MTLTRTMKTLNGPNIQSVNNELLHSSPLSRIKNHFETSNHSHQLYLGSIWWETEFPEIHTVVIPIALPGDSLPLSIWFHHEPIT